MKKSAKLKEGAIKKSPTSKSRTSKASGNIIIASNQVYQIVLKSIISSIVPHCPKEILIEVSKFINTIYPKLKDLSLNSIMENDTVERRELIWKNVTFKIQDVLFPLMQAINAEQKPLLDVPSEEKAKSSKDTMDDIIVNNSDNHQETVPILNYAIKTYAQRCLAEKKSDASQLIPIYWPKPLEINFLQIKDADDVATISCKVGGVTIPYAMIDSGSDSSIISENIAKHLGLKIDKKKVHRLNGVASKSHSLGTVDSVPVTIEDGKNRDTIPDEFSVVPTEYDDNGKELSLFILGTQWQYRAGWEPLVKGEFRVSRNGKTITIPLSVHKSQRNVFTIGKEPEPIKKN
jgi:hypothetical protein